jgi:hypothetical protein
MLDIRHKRSDLVRLKPREEEKLAVIAHSRRLSFSAAFAFASIFFGGSSQAQTPDTNAPLAALERCRGITDPASRLSCYDAAVAALNNARAEGSVVVLDRSTVQEAQRRSFGFGINTLNPFSRSDGPAELESVTSTLKAARQVGPSQRWLLTLEDGSVWLQTDTTSPYIRRPQGQEVRIRRASLGSYLMTVANSAAFSVRRQNAD